MDIKNESEKLLNELLDHLEIKARLDLSLDESGEEKVLNVVVNPDEEAGLLIGAHGSTLAALQSFLTLSLKQKTGEWTRVNLDIGDWREKHDTQLKELAEQAAMRARESGEPQNLYNLTPAQRRVVHVALSEIKGISTESIGEGAGRYLVVKKSSEK